MPLAVSTDLVLGERASVVGYYCVLRSGRFSVRSSAAFSEGSIAEFGNLEIAGSGPAEFHLTNSFLSTGHLTLGPDGRFAVRFTPRVTGPASQDLGFTSDACPETVLFSVRGRGVQPEFEITSVDPPGPVQILTCEIGVSRQFKATVTNTGGDPITVTDGSIPPVGFAYDPAGQFPFTLQPGQTHEVVLRLTAAQPGTYGGMLTISARPFASASKAVRAAWTATGKPRIVCQRVSRNA